MFLFMKVDRAKIDRNLGHSLLLQLAWDSNLTAPSIFKSV